MEPCDLTILYEIWAPWKKLVLTFLIAVNILRVSCPFNNKLEIINSGLYNGSARLNYTATSICLPVDHTTHIVKSVTQLLKMECSQYSCLISMDTIKRLLDEPTLTNLNDLILDINYSCQASGKRFLYLARVVYRHYLEFIMTKWLFL